MLGRLAPCGKVDGSGADDILRSALFRSGLRILIPPGGMKREDAFA